MGSSAVGCIHFAHSNGCWRFLGDAMAVSFCGPAIPAHAVDRSMSERGADVFLCPSGNQAKCLARTQSFTEIMVESGNLVYDSFRSRMDYDSDQLDSAYQP